MQRFLIRRFIMMIITLIAVSMIIFIMARVGGDPRVVIGGVKVGHVGG